MKTMAVAALGEHEALESGMRRSSLAAGCLLTLACSHTPATTAQTCPSVDAPPRAAEDEYMASSESETHDAEIGEACSGEVHRRFDFWLGSWVVHAQDAKLAGHNRIERAHQGCALLEHWQSARGSSGSSINYFDPDKQLWVQNWIDASGSVIQLEGDLRDGAMVLEGRYVQADGTAARMRGIWTPLDDGRVRQYFETSSDAGASWQLWFEGFYTRRGDG